MTNVSLTFKGQNLGEKQHELLWNQLEAEIHLHRHKTVIKACRSKRNKTNQNSRNPTNSTPNASSLNNQDEEMSDQMRTVKLKRKNSREGLGISITGGREHGVPILISEIHSNGPAARSGQLYVGDAILAVNDIDLKETIHSEAVEILSNLVNTFQS